MPYVYVITSDKKLLTQYFGFNQASRDAFDGDDKQRFEAILTAQDFRKQLLERLMEIKGSDNVNIIDPTFIESKENNPSVIERLAALMLDKPSLKSFVKQNQEKLSKEMCRILNDVMKSAKDNEYVIFWMVSEDELDEIL
ncbi:MAG: hypothetical protein PHW20_01290 [Clostridia bacterium]|nr:hypothetical protein [Clostridia bacterium]